MFDPSALPPRVQGSLMLVGYWLCPQELRGKVDRWPELDEEEAAAAENDLGLMAAVMAR